MAYPNTIDAPDTSMQGTSLFTGDDHSLQHRVVGSAVINIETVNGTTAGTSVLKNFAAGDFAARINSSNVLQQSLTGTLGISAGSITGQITNTGTIANGVYGTAQWTGGTLAPSVVSGSVIGSANILNGNVVEEKMRMNLLKGTILASGTTASLSLVGVVGGSVTINLPVASNVMIYFSAWTAPSGGGNPLYALYVDGTIDSTWVDTIGQYNPIQNSFTAWRTGYAAGNHTWQIQWRVAGGTVSLGAFELVVQPFSQ